MTPSSRLLRFLLAPIVVIIVLLLWLASAPRTAAQTPTGGQGVIEGQAVMASAGSSASLSNLPASLFTFIAGQRQVPPAVSQTDAQGRVRFEQLNTSSNYTYTLFIKFGDTIYQSEVISFTAGRSVAQAVVKVYDVTSDDRALRLDQHHLIVDLDNQAQALSILELYLMTNSGDRAIVGAPDSAANNKRVSFRAPLPPDALIESIEGRTPNEDIFQSGNELLDTVPIAPGQSSLVFSYKLPYQRATFAFAIGTPVTTTALNLLVAPDISVRSPRLTFQENVQAGNRQFQRYSARDLSPGTSIAVELSNLPAPLIPLDVLQWLPLAAASLALAVALFIASRRKNADVAPRRQTPA